MEQSLIQDGKDVKVITEEGDLEVTFNDTKHKYIIDEEGNIEKVKDLTLEEVNKKYGTKRRSEVWILLLYNCR